MPTYAYECTHCGHNFDIFQKITDKPLGTCPKCIHKLKRIISSGACIIFKGSGFYATDYRKKPKDQAPVCPKLKEGCKGCEVH